jgi:hypothetical protein
MIINTTKGPLDDATLARTLGFEERPSEFVVWIEYRLGAELVRRDAHVILKDPGVGATAIAGAFNG